MNLAWHWTPGAGGLLALVPASVVEAGHRGAVVPAIRIPDGCAPVRPLHFTCLSSRSMAPLVGLLDAPQVIESLPELALPPLHPGVHVATRAPHPIKDPTDCTIPRRTGFLAVAPAGQQACHAILREVVRCLDRASRRAGGPPFLHPEPDRFFHLSVWNNRGGESMRSIGDICAADLASPDPLGLPSLHA